MRGHALDLARATEAVDGGDAGPTLDPKARAAYRARLTELIAERDAAAEWNDPGRVDRIFQEIDALTTELERAFGLGGRKSPKGSG
jgi:non-specific serine/threonine protein kinase